MRGQPASGPADSMIRPLMSPSTAQHVLFSCMASYSLYVAIEAIQAQLFSHVGGRENAAARLPDGPPCYCTQPRCDLLSPALQSGRAKSTFSLSMSSSENRTT